MVRQFLLLGGLVAGLVVAAGVVWLRLDQRRTAGDPATLELPGAVAAWTARRPMDRYDPATIFNYIDGHAEVYLAYGMRRCLTRRYAGPDGEADIVVDLFELESPEDAFGVATYDRDGSSVSIGRDGLLRHGWLSFWQGPYFVSVLSERETERSREAALAFGRAIAARLPGGGAVPAVVSALPPDGLDPRTIRFLRHPQILNTHVFLDDENLLGLGPTTSAALGRYARGGLEAYLLVVDYTTAAEAARASRALEERFALGEAGGPADVAGRGWIAARAGGARLALAIDAGSRELASSLIDQALDDHAGGAS